MLDFRVKTKALQVQRSHSLGTPFATSFAEAKDISEIGNYFFLRYHIFVARNKDILYVFWY